MNTPNCFVGLVADFPTERDEEGEAPGKELTEFTRSAFKDGGFEVTEAWDNGGWSWQFDFSTREGARITTTIGFVDDMESNPPRQWLVTNDISLPFFKKLFGGAALKESASAILKKYCEALHGKISSDSRFKHVLWYDPQTFDQPGDEPTQHP